MVKHLIPNTLNEALEALSKHPYQIIGGGTDAMIQYRNHSDLSPRFKAHVMYIMNLKALQGISSNDAAIIIQSMTPLETLNSHALVPPLLRKVILEMASPALRYVATLAGNIVNASPAGDALVPLYLWDTEVVLQSHQNSRKIRLSECITGPKKTGIRADELLTQIIIPKHDESGHYYQKVGGRRADAIAKISFAGTYKINNNTLTDIRMAFGAVSATIVRQRDIENMIIGLNINDLSTKIEQLQAAYAPYIQPIDDQRSNRVYRKQVALNLIADFINHIIKEASRP